MGNNQKKVKDLNELAYHISAKATGAKTAIQGKVYGRKKPK